MFGDNREKYLEEYEVILQDTSLEDYLETQDLTPEEVLYILFMSGYIESPFE